MDSLIPVTVLTGFLGAGKTTLLKRILNEAHGQKIAVIENEFGAENIDESILNMRSEEHIIQMNNGCICCTIREDLRTSLMELVAKKKAQTLDFDRVIIETTGLADPGPVIQTFFIDDDVASYYAMDAVITLVDAKHAETQLNTRQEARRQVGFADHLFITKADLVTAEQVDALKHRLWHINQRAPCRVVSFGEVPLSEVLDLKSFHFDENLELNTENDHSHCAHDHGHKHEHSHDHNCNHAHHHAQDDDVKSFVYQANAPFDPIALEAFLGAVLDIYGPRLLRYKGVLNMLGASHKVIFQGVHQLMGTELGAEWKDNELRVSKFVFIGIDLPQDIFQEGLNQCLVSSERKTHHDSRQSLTQ